MVFIWAYYSADNNDAFLGVHGSSDSQMTTILQDNADYVRDNRVIAMGSSYFRVDDDGVDEHPNTNGVAYRYLCIAY
ncbi:MAG: hypothetical protein ACFE9R_16580 [Candidatus Hermodarchaeota archaeon]